MTVILSQTVAGHSRDHYLLLPEEINKRKKQRKTKEKYILVKL